MFLPAAPFFLTNGNLHLILKPSTKITEEVSTDGEQLDGFESRFGREKPFTICRSGLRSTRVFLRKRWSSRGSLENQIQYYTEFIQENLNWTYVPGYIDEGISGTSTYKRDSFLRMIEDAKREMFDFIITKEISRFSRNTLDSIQYTQELLDNNVGVLFQNDNINTLDSDSEFRLIVMAGVAQDEVRKLSERLKFGFRQSIKNGHVLGNNRLWGYDKKDCKLTIIPEQAEAVKLIFSSMPPETMACASYHRS